MTATPLRILVADDDVDNAQTLGEAFAFEGHHVHVVHSGDAAVAAYADSAFDVAFLDVMMPGKNGVESFLEIRKLRPEAKVYMMTGYSVEQLLRQAMRNGALGFFAKPIDLGRLLRSLREIEPEGIVLIADETPGLGGALQRMMTDAGYSAGLVVSGEAAAATPGSVLIFDLKTPLINGVGLYQRLKGDGLARPTIIITREGEDPGDAAAALSDIAVTGILNKPFDPQALLDRLSALAA